MDLVTEIIQFQRENFLAARFIYGESALDTNLNREIHSTYFTKEKYYFQHILDEGIKARVFQSISVPLYLLQLRGMLTAPVFIQIMRQKYCMYFRKNLIIVIAMRMRLSVSLN